MTAGGPVGGCDRVFDHREVRRALETVSRAIQEIPASTSPTVVAARACVVAFERLERVLVAHFDHEEAEAGFFAEVLGMAPTLARELDALRQEHPRLAEQIEGVVEAARWAGLSSQSWGRVSQGFEAFVRQLERHESAEDLLVADALLTDEGGSG